MKKKFEQQTVVIDRSIWRCGDGLEKMHGVGETMLLNAEGFMCCLGQFSCQLGVPKKDLLKKYSPRDLKFDWDVPFLLSKKGERENNSVLAISAIRINDDPHIAHSTREKKLKALFEDHGIKLTFKGKYNNAAERLKEWMSPLK